MDSPARYSFQSNFNESYPDHPPKIEIADFDDTPFSESFSEILECYDSDLIADTSKVAANFNDMTFDIDEISDIRELDSQWDDDDVDEILVISPKPPRRLSTIIEDADSLSNISSLSEFDFLDCTDFAADSSGTYFVKKRDTRRVYIMKPFRLIGPSPIPEELDILEFLDRQNSPYLPKIRRRILEDRSLFVLMDSYPAGSVLNYVLQDGPLSSQDVLFYAAEIVESISAVHLAGIMHRDISPANIMISNDGHIILTGFENARLHNSTSTNPDHYSSRDCEYRAPEHLLEWACDYSVDWWSFGCVLYFMSHGKHPFPYEGHLQTKAYKQILRGDIVFDPNCAEVTVLDLIRKCLERNPHLRATFIDIKLHEYFAATDWRAVREKQIQPPYIPKYSHLETFNKVPPPVVTNPDDDCEPDSRTPHTPSPIGLHDPCSRNSKKIYSVGARHSVQDLLPKIFRSPSLDELKMEVNKCRISEDICNSKLECTPAMIRSPSYEDIFHRTSTTKLSPEERMALFWESLDKDLDADPPRTEGLFGTSSSGLQSSSRPRKLRKQHSSVISQTNSRLSQLISFSSSLGTGTQNKLRKIRRPKSTPMFAASTVVPHEYGTSKIDDVAELPKGIEKIGSGIGFKYNVPVAGKSKPSICSTAANSRTSRVKLPVMGLGLSLGLGKRSLGGSILRPKGANHDKCGQDRLQGHGQHQDLRDQEKKPGGEHDGAKPLREDLEGKPKEEVQDVFRYGSTLSLVPDASYEVSQDVRTVNLNAVSPVTATDTTANNTPLVDLGVLSASERVQLNQLTSNSLIEWMSREEGREEFMSRATLRLIPS